MQRIRGTNSFILSCVTTDASPNLLVWTKDDSVIAADTIESTTSILRNGSTAVYENLVTLVGETCTQSGVYGCSVQDSFDGVSIITTLEVQGIHHSVMLTNFSFSLQM